MRPKGFSLVEFLVVIGIITTILVFSLPSFINYQKSTKLRSEARILATTLRLGQQRAITEQHNYILQLFTSTNSYQLVNGTTAAVVKDVVLDSEISIADVTGLTDDTVSFNPTGGVAQAGFIYLTNSKNETSTVEIKPSGYVEIAD